VPQREHPPCLLRATNPNDMPTVLLHTSTSCPQGRPRALQNEVASPIRAPWRRGRHCAAVERWGGGVVCLSVTDRRVTWRMARRNAEVLSPRSAPGFLVWDPEMPGHRTCQRLGGGADSAAPARAVWPPTYFMARCDRSAVSSGLHTYKSHPRGPMLHV